MGLRKPIEARWGQGRASNDSTRRAYTDRVTLRPALLVLLTALLIWSGIGPFDRFTWWLEVFPILIGAPILLLTARRFPLSPLLCVLLALHAYIIIL